MNIQQAIQSSANVIRITSVTAGDTYKRFDKSYDDRVYYGIVRAVHNDGTDAIIEAVEYTHQYGNLDVQLRVLKGKSDYQIFPATTEEFAQNFDAIVVKKEREIATKEKEVEKLRADIKAIEEIAKGELQKDLKTMSYSELTQAEYNRRKEALEA